MKAPRTHIHTLVYLERLAKDEKIEHAATCRPYIKKKTAKSKAQDSNIATKKDEYGNCRVQRCSKIARAQNLCWANRVTTWQVIAQQYLEMSSLTSGTPHPQKIHSQTKTCLELMSWMDSIWLQPVWGNSFKIQLRNIVEGHMIITLKLYT